MSQPKLLRVSRDTLLRCLGEAVKDQSAGMVDMNVVAIHAVLVDGGRDTTYPLDTIELEMVPAAVTPPPRKFTAPAGKMRLAAVDGVEL